MMHLMRNIPKTGYLRLTSTSLASSPSLREFSDMRLPGSAKDPKKPNTIVFRNTRESDSTLSGLVQSSALDMEGAAHTGAVADPCAKKPPSNKKDKCGSTKLPSDDMLLDVPVAINPKLNVRLEEYDIKPGDEC